MQRKQIRREYIKKYGPNPEGYELHHIIPVWDGGSNNLDNIEALPWEIHRKKHHERYLKNNDIRDLLGSKIGISNQELRKEKCRLGGKRGGIVQRDNKIGIHSQTKEERLILASRGGKKGAFTQSKWQSEFGKRGGPKNKGFVWLTDGKTNIKYSIKKQKQITTENFIKENPSFRYGRLETKDTCRVCGIIRNSRTIGRYHNEKCKQNNKN